MSDWPAGPTFRSFMELVARQELPPEPIEEHNRLVPTLVMLCEALAPIDAGYMASTGRLWSKRG